MPTRLKIDFVSDVSCPWCIIGLRGLEIALDNLKKEVSAEIRFHPFELNPQMAPEGENIVEHIGHKYGASPEQSAETRKMIKMRAADLGFDMRMNEESRIYNTFDAHRLLHWAALAGKQPALKHALFSAYFTDGQNVSDHDALVGAAEKAGLDPEKARAVLADGSYAEEVRADQRFYRDQGIHAVPAIIINDRYLISGGQPVALFEKALRDIAAEA